MVQNIGRTGPQPNIEIGAPDRNAHSIDIVCHRFDSCSSLQLANVAVVMHSFSSVRVSVLFVLTFPKALPRKIVSGMRVHVGQVRMCRSSGQG